MAENYGSGQLRLTVGQNMIIPNVPDAKIGELTEEPVLQELRYDPSEVMRGLVSCTGMDYLPLRLDRHQRLGAQDRARAGNKTG